MLWWSILFVDREHIEKHANSKKQKTYYIICFFLSCEFVIFPYIFQDVHTESIKKLSNIKQRNVCNKESKCSSVFSEMQTKENYVLSFLL